MSAWDAYITNMKSLGLQICGIYGQDGNAWAQSPELKVSQQEMAKIVKGIRDESFPEGIHLNGVKYTLIGCVKGQTVTAKCRTASNEAEKFLVHAALGKTCVVIGGISGAAERSAVKFVEDIKDYLAKNNY